MVRHKRVKDCTKTNELTSSLTTWACLGNYRGSRIEDDNKKSEKDRSKVGAVCASIMAQVKQTKIRTYAAGKGIGTRGAGHAGGEEGK